MRKFYAARISIQLLKAADLNEMLRQCGVENDVTVQKICSRARNEIEVRETLAKVWYSPTISKELLAQLANKNAGIFEFERALEQKENPVPQIAIESR